MGATKKAKRVATILLIDDDAKVRQLITQLLTADGHEVQAAQDGLEGLRLFHAQLPDLVITDILMPEKDGLEMIRELRAAGFSRPIVAISETTSSSGKLFLAIAKMIGADAGVTKPPYGVDLVAVVNVLLGP